MNTRVKKTLAVAGIASGVGLAVVAGTGMVSAASSSSSSTDPQSGLIDKLVSKFGLNKSDVQAVFDQQRSDMEAQHQQKIEDRLSQAVTDGKITSDQKDKILAKMKEIKADMDANRDSMKDKTPAERKAAMEAKRTELEQWAKDNNIPTQYLMGMMGGPGGHGHGMMRGGMGAPDDNGANNDNSSDSSSDSTGGMTTQNN